MTSKVPGCKPSETVFSEQEDIITDFRGEVISRETIARGQRIINSLSTSEDDAVDFTDNEIFYNALNAKVNMAMVVSSKGRYGVTLKSLSLKLLIS